MLKRKKTTLGLMLLLFSCSLTRPISLPIARGMSSAIGLGAAGALYLTKSNALIAVMGGCFAGVLSNLILYSFTPEGRLERAHSIIDWASKNPMATETFESAPACMNALQEVYIMKDLWLVEACRELTTMLNEVRNAYDLLEKARNEKAHDPLFVRACTVLTRPCKIYIRNLTATIKTIRNDREYIAQVKIYQEMIAKEKELNIQQQMADAAISNAQAQHSIASAQHQMASAHRDIADIKGIRAAREILREDEE